MKMRLVVATLAIPLLIAGCGAPAPIGEGGPTPSSSATITPSGTASATPYQTTVPTTTPKPTPTRTLVGSRTVTEGDSGRTISLQVGESVTVSLGSEYDPPAAQGTSLERTSSSGGYPTGRPVHATFRAVRRGSGDISSSTDYACLHSTPRCMLPQRLWTVHVVVG